MKPKSILESFDIFREIQLKGNRIAYSDESKEDYDSEYLLNFFSNKCNKAMIESEDEDIYEEIGNLLNGIKEEKDEKSRIKKNEKSKEIIKKSIKKIINDDNTKLINTINSYDGSLIFQKAILILTKQEIKELFYKILPDIKEVMCSNYGNYFFQKFVLCLKIEERIILLNKIKHEFVNICSNIYGTYSIESLIQIKKETAEVQLFDYLIEINLGNLITNENSYHLIIELIKEVPEEKRKYLNDYLIKNIDKISSNEYGYSCIKKLILFNVNRYVRSNIISSLKQKFYNMVINNFCTSILILSLQTFGCKACKFMIDEVKLNYIQFININELAFDFLIKLTIFMSENDINSFNYLFLSIFTNDIQLYNLSKNKLGRKYLIALYKHSSIIFRSTFYQKFNFILNKKSL